MPQGEHFIVIVVVMFGLLVAWAVLLGIANRRRSGTSSARRPDRRDVIAEGVITDAQLDEMLEAENARLRAHGRQELTRGELEARVAGDARTRWRLLRLRHRRRPERARDRG
jgi:hypothetical protein